MSTTVLTVAALGDNDMTKWCGGWAVKEGRTAYKVPSPADLSADAIPKAAEELNTLIHVALAVSDDDIAVLAHSQGCQVVGEWLDHYHDGDPDRVRFILTGNLERQHFGYAANKVSWIPGGNLRGLTRDDTEYEVLDIGRKDDLWANFPGGLWPMLRLPFCTAHLNYDGVDPDALNPISTKVVGNTTYVTVP